MKSKSTGFFQPIATILFFASIPAVSVAANVDWKGSTGSYNDPSAWNSGSLPTTADTIFVNRGIVQVNSGDPAWAAGEIRMGLTATSSSIIQDGPDVTIVSGKWLRMGVAAGSTSTYTLKGGILTTPNTVYVGEAGTAVLNVDGGTLNKTSAGTFVIGNRGTNLGGAGSSGTVNHTAGTVTSASQIWLGWQFNATAGNTTSGIYNLSGGTLNANSFLTIGRSGGNGIFNMTGGTLNKSASGNVVIGSKDNVAGGTAEFNHSAGTINSAGVFSVGASDNLVGTATGTYKLEGEGILNANNSILVGTNGGIGTITLTGGVITKNAVGSVSVGSNAGGVGIIDQSGGTFTSETSVSLGDTLNGGINGSGMGTWNLSSTGVANLGTLIIGNLQDAQGAFNLDGGTLTASAITSSSTGAVRELNFNGGTLKAANTQDFFMTGLSAANIKQGGAIIDSNAVDATFIQPLLDGGGGGGLTKKGMGTLILTEANTYTGKTEVLEGALSLSIASLHDGSTVRIAAAGATLDLSHGEVDTVDKLFIGGVQKPAGVYKAIGSPATGIAISQITGSGSLKVLTSTSSNTFADWISNYSPATGFDTDSDNDGIPNGVENVLGTNPSNTTVGLTQIAGTASSITFKHALNPELGSDVSYRYEWSTDLIEWRASGVANTGGNNATITASAPVGGEVTVTIATTAGSGGKLFGRLVAEIAP